MSPLLDPKDLYTFEMLSVYGILLYIMVWYGMFLFCGMVQYGNVYILLCGMVLCHIVWYGKVW